MTRILACITLFLLGPLFVHATGSDSRTVALLDCTVRNAETTDAELFSAEHLLKVAGIPYIKTSSVYTAIGYGMILTSSRLQSSTLAPAERDSLYSYVSSGGILFAPIVTDTALFTLFGISAEQSATNRYTLRFDTVAAGSECRWLNDTAEVKISLGRTTYASIFTTRAYTLQGAQAVGIYEDSSAALTRNSFGSGKAYALGYSLKNAIQLNLLNKDYDAQRIYSNGFEPGTDAIILFVKGIYTTHTAYSAWLHTSPYNTRSSLMITHDVDATTAYDTMGYYADYEYGMGISATYLITTHYINDTWLGDFYNAGSLPQVQYLLSKGHKLASHSVGHFPDFDDELVFPLGSAGNTSASYQPFYPNNGPTAGGSVYGEAEVSKGLLDNDFGVNVRSFRAGYLAYNDLLINALDSLGYVYNSTSAAGDHLTNFPFRGRYDRHSNGMLSNNIWEIPLTISDVFSSNPITSANYPQKVAIWADVVQRTQDNYAPCILLIHPNRMYKLTAEADLINQLPANTFLCDLETYGDYWRARDSVRFTTQLLTDTLLITVPAALLPLNPMLSFIVDNGQSLSLIEAQDDQGNPLAVIQAPFNSNDIILYFTTPPILSSTAAPEPNAPFSAACFPNPSGDHISISFTCTQDEQMMIGLTDLSGKQVGLWGPGHFGPGRHVIHPDISRFPAGVYFYTVSNGKQSETKKLVIIR